MSSQNRPPFDEWVRAEISRLRAKADALEATLHDYLDVIPVDKPPPRSPSSGRSSRTSKYEPAFQAFARAARPLNLDEMQEMAKAVGIEADRSQLRSVIFIQKKLGRAIVQGDRYLWKLSLNEAAPSDQEDAA